MSRPAFFGIDLGTTTCRCVAIDEEGEELATGSVEVRVRFPSPDGAEVDAEDWWTAAAAAVRACREALSADAAPASVGLSGLMHAPVLVDATGRALCASPLWLDQRCRPDAERLAERFRADTRRLDFRTSVSAPKIAWVARSEPRCLEAATALLLPKDFLRWRMTGELATDESDAAGTGFYDTASRRFFDDVAAAVGLAPAQLPPVRRADELAGRLLSGAAEELGLPTGLPVAVGGADTLCTRLGAAPLEAGTILVYLGTAAWVALVEGPDSLSGIRARDAGATATTGSAIEWLRRVAPSDKERLSYEELDHLVAAVEVGAAGVVFLPHLLGERGPVPRPLARGAFIGLSLAHGFSHLARAVAEGTAFQLRSVLEAGGGTDWRERPLVAVGGLVRSRVWLDVLAGALNRALRPLVHPEAAARGAALLGARAAGLLSPETLWSNAPGDWHRPEGGMASRWEAAYSRFREADQLLAPLG